MTQYDAFEQRLSDALHTGEMPSEGFTARVMAQVAQTPQVKAGSSRQTRKILLTAAACLAVAAIAVPVVFFGTMRAGSAAPESADCAAPAAAENCEEEEVQEFTMMAEESKETANSNDAETDQTGVESGADPTEEVAVSNTELCAEARKILSGMGLESDSGYYSLSAQQVEALHEAMPELELPAGPFVLILEG